MAHEVKIKSVKIFIKGEGLGQGKALRNQRLDPGQWKMK